jgi:DNA-binding NarL/FixJ family response regulator
MHSSAVKRLRSAPGEVNELLRQLCTVVRDLPEIVNDQGEQVLADFEHDGIRCVLLRAVPSDTGVYLSPREQEIVRLIAAGHPNKVIAGVLDISYWTVGTYVRRIFAKLGVTCRAAMVAKVRHETASKVDEIARRRDAQSSIRGGLE